MEDFQTYIESGRLEQYVLGELDATGRAEVEAWAQRSPEVRQELDELQAGLSAFAHAHALTPPAGTRERVLGRVFAEIAAAAPAAEQPAAPTMRVSASNPANYQPTAPAPAEPVASRGGWAIAASVALLLSLGANILLYSRWQQASTDLVAAQNNQALFAAASQVSERRYAAAAEQLHVLRSPGEFKMVALAGTPKHPTARVRVLYDKAAHRVYVDVQQLPPLPAGKQYQLWALDKGKPIDAGMLAAATAAGDSMQQMKDIASAQAFAMTVEPTGGSADPTMTTMTVIGNI